MFVCNLNYLMLRACFINILIAVDQAVQTGKELLQRHFIHHVTHDHDFEDAYLFYRFLGDDKTKALNGKLTHQCAIRPGMWHLSACVFVFKCN